MNDLTNLKQTQIAVYNVYYEFKSNKYIKNTAVFDQQMYDGFKKNPYINILSVSQGLLDKETFLRLREEWYTIPPEIDFKKEAKERQKRNDKLITNLKG